MDNKNLNLTSISNFYKVCEDNKDDIIQSIQDLKDSNINFLKKGNKIHIKKKNRGSFTRYCGGNVTEECIRKGKSSPNPAIRKKATFAANVRTWKHQYGGTLQVDDPRFAEKQKYDEWNNLSFTDKIGRNLNIAKQFITSSPSAGNIYNAVGALFGAYNPEDPYVIADEAPDIGKAVLKPKRLQSAAKVLDKGEKFGRKVNSMVKNGLAYNDSDARHVSSGRKRFTGPQREKAANMLTTHYSNTSLGKAYQKIFKKIAIRTEKGASKEELTKLRKQMNAILDEFINLGHH